MYGYFTFNFFDKNANNTLCIYKSSNNYINLNLITVIDKSFKKYIGMDNVVIIVNKEDFKLIKKDLNLEIFQRDEKILNISIVSFDEYGQFKKIKNLKGSLTTTYLNEIYPEIIKNGIITICKKNSVVNKAPAGTQFKKLTGKISREFIKASDMLSDDSLICFIAFSILPFWKDNKIDYIYVDTMSIVSIFYKLINLKKLNNQKIKSPNIISFSSYNGIDNINFIDPSRTLIFISASSSGSMAEKIIEKYKIEEEKIITLLSFIETNNKSKLLCNIVSLSDEKKIKTPGLTDIKIVGEYFSSQISEPREVLIKFKHAPKILKDNMKIYSDEEMFSIQKVSGVSTKEIFVDSNKLINMDKFKEWFNNQLKFHTPLYISHIIYTNDSSSKELAIVAQKFYEQFIKYEEIPKLLSSEKLGNEQENINVKGILIISAVISKGNELISIGRDLRNFAKDTSRTFLVGISLPSSMTEYNIFKSSLTYSPNRENYSFYNYWTIPIGKREGLVDKDNSWELERSLLTKLDYFEDIDYSNKRIELLNQLSIGLDDNCFNPSIDNITLKLREDFVFWFGGYKLDIKNSSAVYTTISSAIQNARENDELNISDKLISDDYQRSLLSPDCFSRFNDGVIQASLIRTCNPRELDYSIDKNISKKMKEILLGIIKNVDNKRGEAVIEFLLALATKRMKLVENDIKELEKFMKQEEINNKFKDKKEFCLKLIEIALD